MTERIVRISTDDLKKAIDESITQRYVDLEKRVKKNEVLLTGNGDPEKGLVLKVDRLIQDVDDMQKEIKSAKNGIWSIAFAIIIYTVFQIITLIINHGLTP